MLEGSDKLYSDIIEWINQSRADGACLSGKSIKARALMLARNIGMENFKAITSKGRVWPENSVDNIKKFIKKARDLNTIRPNDQIYNIDETTIYLDSSENYTYDKKGAKRIVANTSGNERTRISIAIGASATGKKLPIVLIIPRKKELKNFSVPSNVVLVYKPSGTFNSKTEKTNSLLGSCHTSSETLKFLEDLNIEYSFIPPRLTSLVQPADVCWLKSFKKHYYEKWSNWFLNDHKSFTKNGNLKSPGYAKAIQWISEIWNEFNPSIIKSSFQVCGITSDQNTHFHSTLKHFLTNGPINEYVDSNDGENELEGFENNSESELYSSNENNSSEEEEEERESEVSFTDSGIETDGENHYSNEVYLRSSQEQTFSVTTENSTSDDNQSINDAQSSDDELSSDDDVLYILNKGKKNQNEDEIDFEDEAYSSNKEKSIDNESLVKKNKRFFSQNITLRRSKRFKNN
ncbi:unnamed protein product [Brachionus calyciflorus]|uniref:DDE-1 domain-containing protein n=1 Tax=Brachionus calyciflorus TaxID=104777 RepID=A0A814ARJ6_9BILA|nr:unnamed protein product [Brachionus calyciflorus]